MNLKFLICGVVCAFGAFLIKGCSPSPVETPGVEHQDYAFNPEYEAVVDSLLELMSLEEKVAMLHGNGKFTSAGVERLGITEVQYTDGPLGIREEIERNSWAPVGWTTDSATFFPAGGGLSASWDPELAMKYGSAIGREARARNKDILLAPAVNIIRTPLCGRNYEYFSEDPFLNARMTVPYIQGVQNQDVAACIKHYAINNQETNRGSVNVIADERTVREIYLPVYKAAVEEAHVYSVMGAYNQFRGDYVCENGYLLNKVLRSDWGFRGIVVSDWAATHSTVRAARNGLDVEMGTDLEFDSFYFAQPLLEAVRSGVLEESIVDEKVRNLLRVLLNIRKMDEENRSKGAINTAEHSQIVRKIASESIVLLKNSEGLLPLNIENISSIAVIGDNATTRHALGGYGAGVKAKYEITPLQALQERFGDQITINHAPGYAQEYIGEGRLHERTPSHQPDQALISEAVEAARASDIAIIFGGSNRFVESESSDRRDMQLPFGQVELIKAVKEANPNTVVVMIAGAPFDLVEVEETVSALVWGWFNGSEAGNAIADVLFGQVNPSGKLPFTMPAKLSDSPPHALDAFPGGDSVVYKEGILVGYRWFDSKDIEPIYPFGHGLSYTRFDYTNLGVEVDEDTLSVMVTIKNSGDRAGKEVAQVYVQDVDSEILKPVKELKGFAKVRLEPGEEKVITIRLRTSDLAYFNAEEMSWKVDPGAYKLFVGSSSRDIRGETTFNLE